MSRASLYSKHNDLQVTDATYVLEKYFHLIRWKTSSKENVLDVGCAEGTVTVDVLYPLLPESVQRLVGVDISREMIEFATAQHSNGKVSFRQLDVTTERLEDDLKAEFDHIFSFYCLNWIQDQRKCTSNLYNMLKPEGDVFLVFLTKISLYQAYENLSKHKIWAEYMKDVEKVICPYYYSEKPAEEFRNILYQAGFQVILCEPIDRTYTFKDMSSAKNLLKAMDPCLIKMPVHLKPQFLDGILNELRDLNCIVLNDNQETVRFQYKIVVVHAQKPV